GAAGQDPREWPGAARLVQRGDVAAEGPPGRGQVVAHVAEGAVCRLEPLLGEALLGLDLVELPGGLVQGRLHLLLAALGGRQVVGASRHGNADDQRGHDESGRNDAGPWHVSPPSGDTDRETAEASGMGETGRRQGTIAQPRPLEKPSRYKQ